MTPEDAIEWIVKRVRELGVEYLFHRFYGIYPGIVEDNDDPEKRGRVRVRVLALGQQKAPAAIWAESGVFGGSEGSGFFFPPALQDRVWVQFVAGDPNKPVYMGGFLGKGKGADEFNEVFKRGVRTPGGHWIRLSDEDGDEHVTISASGGGYATMDKDGSVLLASAEGSYVNLNAADPSIVVHDKNGSLVNFKGGKIDLIAADGTTVTLGTGLTIISPRDVVLNASGNVSLKSGTVSLGDGASQSVVLGDSFMGLFNAHLHVDPLSGTTGPPVTPMLPGTHTSTTVKTK